MHFLTLTLPHKTPALQASNFPLNNVSNNSRNRISTEFCVTFFVQVGECIVPYLFFGGWSLTFISSSPSLMRWPKLNKLIFWNEKKEKDVNISYFNDNTHMFSEGYAMYNKTFSESVSARKRISTVHSLKYA